MTAFFGGDRQRRGGTSGAVAGRIRFDLRAMGGVRTGLKKTDPHALIAYLVGRIISGKGIVSLYDNLRAERICVDDLSGAASLGKFARDTGPKGPGKRSIRFRYVTDAGWFIEIAIRGNSFIGYLQESGSHVIGIIRGDSVYIFSPGAAAHFKFMICGSSEEREET